MDISVVALRAHSGGEEMEVTFEIKSEIKGEGGRHSCRSSFIISSKQYLIIGISKGHADEETYDAVSHGAEVWDCVKRGMYLLGFGACSEKALRMKLVSKGYGKDIAEEAVAELVARGLLRQREDALREAEKMAEKLWGSKRIAAGLYQKGYPSEAVNYALNALEDKGIDYVEGCVGLIKKRFAHAGDSPAERKKLFAALSRYGYSASEIKDALNRTGAEI